MDETKRFVFYQTSNEMLSGTERRFGQETSSLITATVDLLQLKLDSDDILIFREVCNLDSTFECGELSSLNTI